MADFSLSKIITLLDKANEQHVNISFAEDVLSVQVQKGKQIDKSLLEELRDNKPFLIHYFKNFGNAANGSGIPAIPKADRDEHTNIPASFAQERLWFIHQLEGSVQYHLPTIIRLKGNLNVAAIRYTLQNIINRHEALRTVIIEQEGKACQKVLPKDQWQLNIVEGSLYKNSPEQLQHFIQQLVSQPFNLSADTMLRAHLIRMEADEHILVVTMHHLASDAWSEPILLNEVLELYSAFTEGRNPQLLDVEIQYADYAIWQRNYLQGEVLNKKIAYWKEKLEGAETLQLPVDIARPVNLTSNGGQLSFLINKQTADQLAGLCQQQGVTLFMLLLSVYKILLYRYSGQQDITVGTSIASRQQRELEGLIGYFVNILALRDEIHPDASFTELLQQVKATTVGAYQHQDVPFEKVVEAVVSERNTGRNPLFQVMLVLANTPKASGINISGLELSFEATEQTTAKFDITFFINETPDGLEGRVQYSTDLYSAAFIRRMTVHFSNLLKAVAGNPQQKAGSLSMLNKEEETRLLNDFNNASVAYPADKSIVDLFEERAEKTPEQTALVFEDESLTYGELNERSNQLAHYLRSKGAGPGKLIPLYVERSAAMMVGMLGILKAGAAYVPVDTNFPQERINYMLQNTDATIVVSNSSVSAALEDADVEIVETDDDTIISYQPKTNLAVKPSPKDLVYVIYTSGSTGRPKGVMVTHQNIVDYYFGLDKYTSIKQCQSFALVSTIATDLGNTVIFASLLSSGALHVFSKTSVSNAAYLQRYFQEQQIDCVKIVPSHWKVLFTDDELLLPKKLIIFGGEALPSEAVQAIQSSGTHCAIVNHYGPTETTVGKLLHPVQPETEYGSTIPIGKPFSNTHVYVLTKELQLCPQGIPGQLFIAGNGVAKGYYNNESLTAEKFIDNPFILSNTEKKEWGKMYATGDKVKWLPDGNILFMGRADDQVKIRGYRVEPGEVESTLQQCSLVKAAAVLAIEDKQDNKKLIAYIVAKEEFDREEILAYLKEKLPEYMVPAVLVPIDALPLTANGKINRKALPHPDETETAAGQYVAPRNEAEKTMAALWADILELEEGEVGIHNDFFELGGHSLLAVRLVSGIRKAFGVEVSIGDVFDYPTVAALTTRLNNQSEKTVLPSITKQLKPEHIPLSFSQERLWFIDQLDGSVQYHIPAVLRLKGKLDKQALANALQQIINRHEVLRTVIIEKDGQPFQSIKEVDGWELQMVDGHSYRENKEELQNYIQQLSNWPFRLSEDYMLRASLISLQDDENVLVVTLHHISSDAWSNAVMVNELMEFYHAGIQKREASLIPLPIQYADFAIWQRNYLQGALLDKKLAYWKEKLQGVLPLQLLTDMQRPAVQSTNGSVRVIKIKKELADSLQHLSQQQGTTLFMTLLASLNVLLHRYIGQEDICVGTPVAGRQQAELETLIGFFVNTLALRCALDGNTSFKDLLQQVKAITLGAYEHQDVPFEKVVETVVEQRDVRRSPLFQVMLVLQNTPRVNLLQLENLELQPVNEPRTTSKFDLTFAVTETTEGLTLLVEYCTDLYAAPTIDKMMAHYVKLLYSAVQRPEQKISLLPMLSVQEEQQLLNDFNNTAAPYATDKTVVHLFEEQVNKTPDNIAIEYAEHSITYQQLNEKANQLAHHLRSLGVEEETLVPVCMERSVEMIIAILAILKAGGAYVPIDPAYPAERIRFMLADTKAQVVICNKKTEAALPDTAEIIKINIEDNELFSHPGYNGNPQAAITPQQLAYVMYTSGSTGKPKGVLVEHGNVVSLVKGIDYVSLTGSNILLSTGSVSFDATTFEYWGTLLNGGRLILCAQDVLLDSQLLKEEIAARKVNMMWFTSSWLNQLVDSDISVFKGLETILAGGERLSEKHIGLLKNTYPEIIIINGYGPTENTTFSLTYTITSVAENNPIPIGKPLSNRTALVLDTYGQLTPVGVAGEICLGGAGLARGYLNQPRLTADKFIKNTYPNLAGTRLYKTGDWGRWLPDGNIEYGGRRDEQVKINGYRIELGEIETVLQQSGLVEQAVVVAKEDPQLNKRLVGYIVPKASFERDEMMSYFKERLPAYMVPQIWVVLEAMPLTSNGKIDRKALPEPDGSVIASLEYVAPRSETESALVEIWQELLRAMRIGIHDNFFELGGHSLLAMRLVSAIRKKLQAEVDLKTLFVHPTIAAFSTHLQTTGKALLQPAVQAVHNRPEHIPLSFSQERLWFIHKARGSVAYHLPFILRLKGILNKDLIQNALQNIINRHEVLRTIIPAYQGKSYQLVQEKDGWELDFTDGSVYENNPEALQQYIRQLISKPFDLSRDYMLRADLVKLHDTEHILVVTIHHIAADGWSVSILVNELTEIIKAIVENREPGLTPLPLQYADYAIWQRQYLQGDILTSKLDYWKGKLKEVATLQLPTDYPRPVVQSSAGAQEKFTINKDLADKLKLLSRQEGTTLFMTLLTAFNILMQRYSGQQDICIGTPIAGRSQPELELLIGLFINSLALRSDLSKDPSFINLLQQVKTTTLEAYAHAEIPFEKVVEIAGNQRDTSRNPLFQVLLSMQNTPEVPELQLGGITLTSENYGLAASQLDIIWNIAESPNGLQSTIVYCTDLFTGNTIRQMTAHFRQLLEAIVQAPQQSISSFSMLGMQEQQDLLLNSTGAKTNIDLQKTVVHLFEEQVAKTPNNTAVAFKFEELTYQQLNDKANQLASYLLALGVKKEQPIPICLENGPEMLIAILGILKAGATYVPIDPAYPQERINYLLEDTAAALMISHTDLESRLPEDTAIRILTIDGDWEIINTRPTGNVQSLTVPDQLAYIIYTSGSTGRPKGVMVEHSSLVNYLLNNQTNYTGGTTSVAGSFMHLSYTFDASLTGLFMPLLSGKTVVISSGQSLDIFEDDNLHKYAPYSFIKITPAHLQLLYPKMVLPDGRLLTSKLVVGGEALLQNQLQSFFEEGLDVTIINEYGPTEATVGCSVFSLNTSTDPEKIRNAGSISIGKPINNTQIFILGNNNELLPAGVTGELCIAGAGLARGYLNQPDLTAEKFIKNPFDKEGKLYKTGDLARWSADGNITYIGRNDEQVKIRGYRVETGEIESVLNNCSLVKSVAVVAKENKEGSKRLVAYVVPEGDFNKAEIQAFLQRRLPDYMIPVQWVPLQTLPLTTNGKIDRRALPDTDAGAQLTKQFTAPHNEMETALAQIWQELLDVETVGVHDNFFELGGDSIIIIQIVSRARCAGYEFQVSDLFTHQTIAALSAAIDKNTAGITVAEQEMLSGTVSLLPIQQWYLGTEQRDISYYNQGILLSIDKVITSSELAQAFEMLADHHDALRFKYSKQEDTWLQEYGINKPELITEELQAVSKDLLAATINEKATAYQSSLHIEKGDIVRTVLMQTPHFEPKNRLLVIIHHLAVDGVSWRILLNDLELLLNGVKKGETVALGAKTSSYRQWYSALKNYGQSRRLLSQQNYWQQAAINYQPLPADKEEAAPVQVKDISYLYTRLPAADTTQLLQEAPRAYHTEINDILLAALAQTLCNWSNQEKVIIGMDGHGREPIDPAIDIHRTIGWFTSLYPLVLSVPQKEGEADIIKSVKEQLRQVPDKGIGYGVLKYINKDASLQSFEPWDIAFNYLDQLDNAVKESKWLSGAAESAGPLRSSEQLAGEKISVNSSVRGGELTFNWSYSSKHYHKETIEKLSENYVTNLQKLIAHCIAQQQATGPVFTPSDYGLGAEINYEELDHFLSQPYKGKKRSDYIDGLYRLSGLQEGMLFHGLYDVAVGAYIQQMDCKLDGVNIDLMKSSWAHLLNRHSILRTAFYFNEFRVPVQCVYSGAELPVVLLDYREMDEEEQAAAIKAYDKADWENGIDFKTAPLMRLALFRLGENTYRMLLTSHHILFDGWSFNILIAEFLNTYEQLYHGKKREHKEEDRYEDYIRFIERSDKGEEEQYWRKYLTGIEHSTLLPFISKFAERNKGIGSYGKVHLLFDSGTTLKIQSFAQRHHLTVNTLMQGIWAYLLHQYTGEKNVVYGVVVSGRPDSLSGVEQRVGMYINTLLFHSAMDEQQSVTDWLNTIQTNQVASRRYQHTPLHKAQGWSGIPGDLFDTMITFENYPIDKLIAANQWALNVSGFHVQEYSNYPLSILISSTDEINILFSYNTMYLDEHFVDEIKNHFENVLLQLIETGNDRISKLNLLTVAEQQQLLNEFNKAVSPVSDEKTVIHLFEEQAQAKPDAMAIIFGEEKLTYQQLNSRANQLARHLKKQGITKESLVPICLARSVEMLVSLFGILKAGAAYVPIDPDYPEEKVAFMLEDTGAAFVITDTANRVKIPASATIEIIDIEDKSIAGYPADNLNETISGEGLAYIIYTSGSTGKQKGVMVEHQSLTNYLLNSGTHYINEATEATGSFIHLSYTFDASLTALFMPLIMGKPVVISTRQSIDIFEDANLLRYAPYDFIKITPAHLEFILPQFKAYGKTLLTEKLVIGGEALHAGHFDSFIADHRNVEIINEYGPTEATVGCTTYSFKTIDDREKIEHGISIGKPIDHATIYIINENHQLVPVGVGGEICIGGAGVARGYLNRKELTEEKFISNPFGSGRMYKTGDIGRWLPDGNIEFLGRIDDQVKIRGYRIEPGEIENVLQQYSGILQAVVMAHKDRHGNKSLVAYVVTDGNINREALITYLKKRLPTYMIPQRWVQMESFPLTTNGKIDKKALPAPDTGGEAGRKYVAPTSETEAQLAEIWQELLGVKQPGIHEDFFELGGHSILVGRMVPMLKKRFGLLVPIPVIFKFPTIYELGNYLEWEKDPAEEESDTAFELIKI